MFDLSRNTLDPSVLSDIVAVQHTLATAELSPAALMELISQSAVRLTDADGACIATCEPEGFMMRNAIGCVSSFLGTCFKSDKNLMSVVRSTHKILVVGDILSDPRSDRSMHVLSKARSIILVPLLHGGELVGLLNVVSLRAYAFTTVHYDILQLISGLLASALVRAVSHSELALEMKRAQMRLDVVMANRFLLLWSVDKNGIYTYCEGGVRGPPPYGHARVGHSIFDVYREQPSFCNSVRRALQGRRGDILAKIDGRWYEDYVTPYRNEAGEIESLVGMSVDITDRMEAEELRSARLDSLMREKTAIQASEVKSRLLASVSHELRTPLNGVLGLAKMLHDTSLDDVQRSYVHAMLKCGDMLLSLANDVLDVSKVEAGKMVLESIDFDLPDLLHDVEEALLEMAHTKGLTFTIHVNPSLPLCFRGDPTRMRQVLMNLVSNAVKFTDHGSVTIGVDGERRDEDRYMLRVTVQDSGIGISAESLSHIFDSFMQADASITRRFGGAGLGLSICKHLVSMMQGSIEVHSKVGHGSTFRFEVPLLVGNAPKEIAAPAVAPILRQVTDNTRPLRVLVADDNSVNLMVARKMVEKMGHACEVATDGLEVLMLMEEQTYDLILMDCQMPELDGYRTTEIIRAASTQPGIPIVAMTASAMPGDRERCLQAGMNAYVSKPITYEDLEDAIARMQSASCPVTNVSS